MSAFEKLDELAAAGDLQGFTLWRATGGDYQANLQTGKNAGWRVMRGDTPSEAIAAVLAMDFVEAIDEANNIVGRPLADFGEAAVAELEAEEPEDFVDFSHEDRVAELDIAPAAEPGIFD